jgi:hypothetical protein
MDADVLGCINIQYRTTFNALYPALEASSQSWDSRVHINGILVSNDPAAPRNTARAPRKTAGSMGTASGTSSAVGVGSLTVTADVTMAQETGVAATVILGFPPEAEPFRTAIKRHAKEILSLLESNPEEMHLIEAELARRVRSKKHGNMIAALGYDRDTFPTVAAAASLLNRDARTVLELVNIDRALPWSLKSIHQNLEETAKLFRTIAAVLDGFGKTMAALTKIVIELAALVTAVVGLLAALGVL